MRFFLYYFCAPTLLSGATSAFVYDCNLRPGSFTQESGPRTTDTGLMKTCWFFLTKVFFALAFAFVALVIHRFVYTQVTIISSTGTFVIIILLLFLLFYYICFLFIALFFTNYIYRSFKIVIYMCVYFKTILFE